MGDPEIHSSVKCTPLWIFCICSYKGKLTMVNTADNIKHEFLLVGIGKEPLPIDTVLLKCHVGQTVDQTLKVSGLLVAIQIHSYTYTRGSKTVPLVWIKL